ncbi:MAG: hypothetical protein LBD37_09770 [Treponema sp.]|nr:hypothetical protein [Treponema sp.]
MLNLLVIALLAFFWYCLVPAGGAFAVRRRWRRFRRRFDDLRLYPMLNYAWYSQGSGGIFRYIGGFESLTGRHTLWLRSEDLTIPVVLSGADAYVLSIPEKDAFANYFDPLKEAPVKIRWHEIRALAEGAKVFVGGLLREQENRLTFAAQKDNPLLVIFYNGPDRLLTPQAIRAGRRGNEYWNTLTPYGLILGAFSQILIALFYLQRPAYRSTVICALAAVCVPLLPMIPPGFLLTLLYRRLWQQARVYRIYRDLARLPLKHLAGNKERTVLPNGEVYGRVYIPPAVLGFRQVLEDHAVPLVLPENAAGRLRIRHRGRGPSGGWYLYGALNGPARGEAQPALPRAPADLFATYGAVPGNPEQLARRFTLRAYLLEGLALTLLLAGIGINLFFMGTILLLFTA